MNADRKWRLIGASFRREERQKKENAGDSKERNGTCVGQPMPRKKGRSWGWLHPSFPSSVIRNAWRPQGAASDWTKHERKREVSSIEGLFPPSSLSGRWLHQPTKHSSCPPVPLFPFTASLYNLLCRVKSNGENTTAMMEQQIDTSCRIVPILNFDASFSTTST